MDMPETMFAGWKALRAVAGAVAEGRAGRVESDGDAARADLGCYYFFAGDPSCDGAGRLLRSARAPRELVYDNEAAWRARILEVLGDRVFDRPMLEFDTSGLDAGVLRRFEGALPDGFELRRMDTALASQLDTELEPHGLQVAPNAEAFARDGLGYAAVKDGVVACAATSYTRSSHHAEIAIATRPAFRGHGLAAATAARLLRHCLETGLEPCWSASNPVSHRLAARLGYGPGTTCEVLYLHG